MRSARTLQPLPVPISRITFNPQTRCYGFAFSFAGRPVQHRIDTFDTLEWAKRWADLWNERIWDAPSDADEGALLVSRAKRPGAV